MEILSYPVTPFVVNCYVLRDNGEAIVVDPGEATPSVLKATAGYLVRSIVNTHCHCDHCGGNGALMASTGAELLIHRADLPLLEHIEEQGQMFGVPMEASPPPTRFLEEGDKVTFGGVSLTVLHAPGHSPGHVILLGEGFILCGDVLFAGSIGRTDLPGGSYGQLLESIRTKILPLPDPTIVYSGHGPHTTVGEERRTNPFLAGL
jgi:glyoxylase-like metal-dependent hydrolase (beta-lactamase superfamily II)